MTLPEFYAAVSVGSVKAVGYFKSGKLLIMEY